MSSPSEQTAARSEDEACERGRAQRASGAPGRQLSVSQKPSGQLPEQRETGRLSWLWFGCSWLAVAAATVFAAFGIWQLGALVGLAQEAAHEVAAARTVEPKPARVEPAPSPRAATAPVLTATGNAATAASDPAKAEAPAALFEAQAEASEKVVPVGLEAALDDASRALTLGQPPPAGYPRVGCEDIFVYIVTVAEGAPRRSAASIGVGKKGPARFRRPGERIGDWTVLAITDDWTGIEPDVWLEKDGTACRAELAGNPSRIHQPLRPPVRHKARRRRR